jgi:2'-5' RNA ligase
MRGFIALNLTPAAQRELAAAAQPLCASDLPVRWVDPALYHVTLKFLGFIADGEVDRIGNALAALGSAHSPVRVHMRGGGAFPDERRPGVFWIGVEQTPPLIALQQDVEGVIAPLGYPTEQRAFHPHVTLGRTRRDAAPSALRGAVTLLRSINCDITIEVETVDLMSSHSSTAGSRYQRELAATLAA